MIFNCSLCGKEYKAFPSAERKFCSLSCSAKVVTRGNKNAKGAIRSKETREKMAIAKFGNKFGQLRINTKHSDTAKQKMSKSHKGKVLSPEHRLKIVAYLNHKKGAESNFWKGGVEQDRTHVRERATIQKHKRRIRLKNNGGSFSLQEWRYLKEKFSYTCPACGRREPEITLSADHIIPVSKGGVGDIENIQPLCKSCNSRKHTMIIAFEKNGQTKIIAEVL